MGNEMRLSKRQLLVGIGAGTSTLALAGCLGDDTEPEDDDDHGGGSSDDDGSVGGPPEPDDEEPDEFTLEGSVADADGADPIHGAVITVGDEDVETDEDGRYAVDGLSDGEYTVTIEADGYESAEETIELPGPSGDDLKLLTVELDAE